LIPKPTFCQGCPINHHTGEGYVPLKVKAGDTLLVGETAGPDDIRAGEGFSGGSGVWIRNLLRSAGKDFDKSSTLSVLGCRPPDNIFPTAPDATYCTPEEGRAAVEYCEHHHLWPQVEKAHRPKIYAIGAKALESLTGRRGGINMWRGSLLTLKGSTTPCVVPTIHPAALMRQAKLVSVVARDFRRPFTLPPEKYNLFPSLEDVHRFTSRRFAFDLEWGKDGKVTLCGLSDRFFGAIVVPWCEPYLSELKRIFENAEELIGHNIINADLRYVEMMGWELHPDLVVSDTMLKQHLIQPDYPHDLGFVASVFTNKVYWKGKGWDEFDEKSEGDSEVVTISRQQWKTWDSPDAIPRKHGGYGGCLSGKEAFALYNARDCAAEYEINTPIDAMIQKWDLHNLYQHTSRPLGYICRWIGERGLKLDTTRLVEVRKEIDGKIADLEEGLPDGLRPYTREVNANIPAPPGTLRAKSKVCKGTKKVPHDPFTHTFLAIGEIQCEGCGKKMVSGKMHEAKIIKGTRLERVAPYNSPPLIQEYIHRLSLADVYDHKTGRITTGKKAQVAWGKTHKEFAVLGALKKQLTLRNNFAKSSLVGSVELGLPPQERMFFNLKVHGTGTGRFSGSGQRAGIDLNPQNQPAEFRHIYIPDYPDWGFINIDLSQGESWLTCWLAKDWERWEKLKDPSYDEHSELASAIFNTPITKAMADGSKAIKALRQIGKKTNHASAYGMGYKKFHEVLTTEGYEYTLADAREFLATWKKLNAVTVSWQKETIGLCKRQGYLRNPFGRVRWFSSRSGDTDALAFLPQSTLADCMHRFTIAHYPHHFLPSIHANLTSVYHPLSEGWVISIQIHDALLFQGPWGGRGEQRERSSQIMSQPFPQLGGFAFRVDVSESQRSWGEC
jgi:uracil-DNA glycosylase family 4